MNVEIELGQAISDHLHRLADVDPCRTGCTHRSTDEYTLLGISNIASRVVAPIHTEALRDAIALRSIVRRQRDGWRRSLRDPAMWVKGLFADADTGEPMTPAEVAAWEGIGS